jgi:DNA-binding winged helix-turn-helix (wHTH) protein
MGAVRTMIYRFGSFALDVEQKTLLTIGGREVPLRPKSFALLHMLVENAGMLVSKEAIMEALWPNVFVTENNITQCVHEIRSALGADGESSLRTRPRRGYVFTQEIIRLPASRQPSPRKDDDQRLAGQARPGRFGMPPDPGVDVVPEDAQSKAQSGSVRRASFNLRQSRLEVVSVTVTPLQGAAGLGAQEFPLRDSGAFMAPYLIWISDASLEALHRAGGEGVARGAANVACANGAAAEPHDGQRVTGDA